MFAGVVVVSVVVLLPPSFVARRTSNRCLVYGLRVFVLESWHYNFDFRMAPFPFWFILSSPYFATEGAGES